MDPHERRIVQFLSIPRAYPHPVGTVARRETHVSHVFLAGQFAYKLKKPVKFPFLDASTLVRRKRFCRLELSLNRRLAPDVYLGTVPVVETSAGLRLGGASPGLSDTGPVRHRFRPPSRAKATGRVVEWVVKMRRLSETRMLDRLVAAKRVGPRDMVRLADRLIPFFKHAARSRTIDRFGMPAQVGSLSWAICGSVNRSLGASCLRRIGRSLRRRTGNISRCMSRCSRGACASSASLMGTGTCAARISACPVR